MCYMLCAIQAQRGVDYFVLQTWLSQGLHCEVAGDQKGTLYNVQRSSDWHSFLSPCLALAASSHEIS